LQKIASKFSVKSFHYSTSFKKDSSKTAKSTKDLLSKKNFDYFKGKKAIDSVKSIRGIAIESIIFTTKSDSTDLNEMSGLFERELQRKNITVAYSILQFKSDKLSNTYFSKTKGDLTLKTDSKSAFLPDNQGLKLRFSDPTLLILKRSITGIILSLLLSLSIIGCLFYLLKIINKQKKIDAVKNDLISNITHEFKTPITTISSAIEGIRNFNSQNDTEKTNRYLSISEQQIHKLTNMVEKLLETASLDTDELKLKKESLDLVVLLQSNIDKHQLFCPQKRFSFDCNFKTLATQLDAFHFENVVSNLLDNAIKYGGTDIEVSLNSIRKNIEINFTDNGFGIPKEHQDKIFEQFYRIAKGNIHNVKGFGIGLYYSKKIIEKHGGTLSVVPNSKTTNFKITLPNG
jgi:two-component system phosphate regulon sensor histidine kinase PhoR